ncbi:MAG: hypothetical protein ER33_08280 [Cyanobium sp. CACIAM 14]|nr:MAG: hypothetical protein ER33_08280 [Cyanobium sp. CACIAM 14]
MKTLDMVALSADTSGLPLLCGVSTFVLIGQGKEFLLSVPCDFMLTPADAAPPTGPGLSDQGTM